MARKRRSFSGAFKAKVALAACRDDKTTAQLAAEYEVHVGQITAWKKQLWEHAAELFILVELDEIAKKKMRSAPSKKVLDELQQLAMDQFAAYQGRIGKVPD